MRATLGIAGIVFLIGSTANVASSDAPSPDREFSIAEDADSGSTIGRLRGADDAAGQPAAVTWSIAHDGHAIPFVIDRRTGELTLADQPLDFERQSRHEFTVRARRPRPLDSARRAYMADLLESGVDPETIDDLLFEVVDQRVVVNVTDAPEPPVLAPSTLALVISDAGPATTAPIQAHDPDANDALTFEVIAGDTERFQIDPATGALTWRASAAPEFGAYPVTVRVTDRAGLSDAATFRVEVIAPAPAVATLIADVVLPEAADVPEPPSAAVVVNEPQAPVEDDPPAVIDPSPVAATSEPETADVVLVASAPPVETDTEPVVAISVPAAAAVVPGSAGSTSPEGFVGQTAGSVASFDLAGWLPLGVALGAGLLVGAWLRRRRSHLEAEAQRQPFRVVREAPAAVASLAARDLSVAMMNDEPPPERHLELEATIAEKAAVHQLLASAFQQATGESTPIVVSAPPEAAALPATQAAAFSVPEAVDRLTDLAAIDETPADTAAADAVPVNEAPVFATQSLESWNPFAEQTAPELIGVSEQSPEAVEYEHGFGTEPYTSPYAADEEPAAELPDSALPDDVPAHPAEPMPTMYGYGVDDEELAGGYHGLRLSQSSAPPPVDEGLSFGDIPAETTEEFRSEPVMDAAEDGDDPKLQELRRQLSDLFGVPADRPRPAAASVDSMDEPESEDHEEEVTPFVADGLAPTIDLQPGMLESSVTPAAPPAPPPPPPTPAPAPGAAPAAGASDPVHSWLEYLKQRALDKPGSPSSPSIAAASSYAAPAPGPVATPAQPASSPGPVATFARQTVPPVRVNKSAVREEISMLRNVANQHSRNVLARRALNQRARVTWLLWVTALVVLCFSGLWSVRHDAGGMRLLGWGLLGGAGFALGCCGYGFHRLNQRAANRPADERADQLATVADLEATAVPDLMSPEMEQRLREVLEEARNVPAPAETRA